MERIIKFSIYGHIGPILRPEPPGAWCYEILKKKCRGPRGHRNHAFSFFLNIYGSKEDEF